MQEMTLRVALGFRAHSGWAAMVAVAGDERTLQILDRRRVVIADPELKGSVQPYHAAAELPFAEAEAFVGHAKESSRGLAVEKISAAIKILNAQGHEVVGCGVVLGSGKELPLIEKILASHALIHTAEGVLFRDVLLWAAAECGLSVSGIRERDLNAILLKSIDGLGKRIGPPWTQDQKLASASALRAISLAA